MKKTNVLFLAEELRIGGAETFFYKIENLINREKFNFYTAAVNSICFDKIKFKEDYFEYKKNVLSKIFTIRYIVKDKNIEMVHANSLRLAIIAVIVKKIFGFNYKIVYTKHNVTILEKAKNSLFITFVNNNIDIMTTVCDKERKHYIEEGIYENKIKTVFNGVDLDQFKFKPRLFKENDITNIGILARLSDEKNHEFFLKIAKELKNTTNANEFRAYIGGDGPLKGEIKKKIIDENLEEVVEMSGQIDEPSKFLEQLDISLLVSKREVFPMSVIESMATGAIVVAKDVGGISDCITNEKTGYILNSDDHIDFSNTILKIVRCKGDNSLIIKNARELVENNFSIGKMINDIEYIYAGL